MTLTKLAKLDGVDTSLEFEDPEGRDVQAIAVIDENGEHAGVTGTPIKVQIEGQGDVVLGTAENPLEVKGGPPRASVVENLDMTTTTAAAVQSAFATLTLAAVRDVLIQNLSTFDCYVTFGGTAVTAVVATHTLLRASGSINLENVKFNNFSVIRIADNVNVRITGIGG